MNKIFRRLAAGTALAAALTAGQGTALAAVPAPQATAAAQGAEAEVTSLFQAVNQPWGLASAPDGALIVASSGSNRIGKWKDGKLTAVTAQSESGYYDGTTDNSLFNQPTYTAVNSKGAIYVSDTDNHVVRRIVNNRVYTAAGSGTAGSKDGKFGEALFNAPAGLAVDAADNVYVADSLNNVIRKMTPEGVTSTFAGIARETGGHKDGDAAAALFNEPSGLAFDGKGGLYVSDSGNHVIRYIYKGKVTTVAGRLTAVDEYTGYMTGGYANGASGAALFNRPRGLAYADGVLFIADSLNNRIRALKPDGQVITLAGRSAPGDRVGAADAAQFNQPSVLLYAQGSLYISDTLNNSIKALRADPKALKPVRTQEDLIAGTALLPASAEVQVWLDGKRVPFAGSAKPYLKGDKLYVPVRSLFEAWGADIKWHAAVKEALLTKGKWRLSLMAGENADVVLQKGSLYVSASHLEKAASFLAARDEEYNAIIFSSGQ